MDEHEVTKRLAAQHSIMETKISRKFMEEHAPFNQLKRWTALAILFILTVIVISLLYLYRTPPDRIFVTRIKGNTLIQNSSKNYNSVLFGERQQGDSEIYVAAQLIEEGDILFANNALFPFNSKNDSFEVSEHGDFATYIDGRLASIQLESNRDLLPWLKTLTRDSIEYLQTLTVESPILGVYFPILKEFPTSVRMYPFVLSVILTVPIGKKMV